MNEFFSGEYHGEPFVLFGAAHLIALAILAAINLALPQLRARDEITQRAFRYTLAAILLVDEALWHLWNWTTGIWSLQYTLPLHVCSLMVFASAYLLVTKNYRVYEFIYFFGIGAATQALLTPDAGIYGFPHFRFFQVMISHGAIVTTAIYMTIVEGLRPTLSSFARVAMGGLAYMAVIYPINLLLGSNYLFIMHKPETPTLIDLMPPWPVYIAVMIAIAFTVFFLLYLPFAISDWRQARA